MNITIELPHVGESVVEGTIGKWLKQPGDAVRRYDPLVEVITDKVTMEVPSPVNGTFLRVLAEEGETVPMGAPIAEMETTDVDPNAAPPQDTRPPATAQAQAALQENVTRPAGDGGTAAYLVKDARPVGPTGSILGEGEAPGGAESAGAARGGAAPGGAESAGAARGGAAPGGAARPSPAVRRLAREHGVDLARIKGTGLGGRITRDDLLLHIEAPQGAAPPAAAPVQDPIVPQPAREAEEEAVTLTPVRRMIAEAMVRSVSEIPHVWSTVEVDVTNLVALRGEARPGFEEREGVDLTYLPFIIKTVVESLKEHPTLNATWGGDKIILKKRINLGIAVAAPQGLIVPVIHDADRMSVAGLAHATQDLAQRARQNKLTLDDVHGGTFTLNNTGALGSILSQPIINHPQAAILTTEAIQKRAVVRDDAIAIRSMMNLCLSFDHRINDGAETSAFLQAVKTRLESIGPDTPIY
ncbi:MAG: 2-oxo acid dehydrogenase subunit E2 [Chloroflexi bacterium]|nr:2-oxo acid dehydrogenase subunit E2 [Chloroflexota bacterium]